MFAAAQHDSLDSEEAPGHVVLIMPENQFAPDKVMIALARGIDFEIGRRMMLNEQYTGARLSTRPEAVARDVMRNWLRLLHPAGVC